MEKLQQGFCRVVVVYGSAMVGMTQRRSDISSIIVPYGR